jgi:N6-adenosine-specific RNA methylase IME4
MNQEVPEMSRTEFARIVWERFCNESMSHHPNTLRYGQMLITIMGWDKAAPQDYNIVVQVGRCLDNSKG